MLVLWIDQMPQIQFAFRSKIIIPTQLVGYHGHSKIIEAVAVTGNDVSKEERELVGDKPGHEEKDEHLVVRALDFVISMKIHK